jgi:hypothetical protein
VLKSNNNHGETEMKRASAIEHDQNGDPIEVCQFEYIEDAKKWCEDRRGAPLVWADTQIGIQGMVAEEWNIHGNPLWDWPPRFYGITGYDEETGEEREILEEDWKPE